MAADFYERAPGSPLELPGHGNVQSIAELMEACRQSEKEASKLLLDGRIEKWLYAVKRDRYARSAQLARTLNGPPEDERIKLFLALVDEQKPKPFEALERAIDWARTYRFFLVLMLSILLFSLQFVFRQPVFLKYCLEILSLVTLSVSGLPLAAEWLPKWFEGEEGGKQELPRRILRPDEIADGGSVPPPNAASGPIAPHLERISHALQGLHTWHAYVLGIIGVVFTGLGVIVAWQESQLHEQQKKINEETLIFSMNKQFEEVFDVALRRRFYRVYQMIITTNSDGYSVEDKEQLVDDLVDERNILFANESFLTNKIHRATADLIKADLSMDFRATGGAEKDTYTSAEIQTELANYHATLMKVLNMLDSLVILHQIAKDDAADPMLREIFWYSTTNRAAHLTPFMDAVDRRRPFEGWHTLREVLRHPEMAGNNADTPKHN